MIHNLSLSLTPPPPPPLNLKPRFLPLRPDKLIYYNKYVDCVVDKWATSITSRAPLPQPLSLEGGGGGSSSPATFPLQVLPGGPAANLKGTDNKSAPIGTRKSNFRSFGKLGQKQTFQLTDQPTDGQTGL